MLHEIDRDPSYTETSINVTCSASVHWRKLPGRASCSRFVPMRLAHFAPTIALAENACRIYSANAPLKSLNPNRFGKHSRAEWAWRGQMPSGTPHPACVRRVFSVGAATCIGDDAWFALRWCVHTLGRVWRAQQRHARRIMRVWSSCPHLLSCCGSGSAHGCTCVISIAWKS